MVRVAATEKERDQVAAYSGIPTEPGVYCPQVLEHANVERSNQYWSK